jgi:NADH-quinone oxidoreductase subunit G
MTTTSDTGAAVERRDDTVTCTVDGFEVTVPKGTLIIRAAELLGIQIPRFCDHPLLDPIGACRQCIVEVEGQRKPLTACTTTVTDDMVVRTQLTSEVAEKAQRGTIEMLLINHPLDCPVCDKGGECPLQNQAMSNGPAMSRFRDVKRTFPKPIAISTQVLLDRERCVLCARCTRFSAQIAGDPFIELFERGALEQVAVYEDEPFESYFSGNTVQICPVGALTGAQYRFRARPFDLVSTPSVCEHCASGCAMRTDWRRGRVLRRLAGDDPDVNEEWNCDKGRWAFQYTTLSDRITTPLIREGGELREAAWTEAIEYAARGLAAARDAGGVGVLPGGRLTLEDAYGYAKFARVALRTNDIDMRARPHSDEELGFLATHVAGSGVRVSYADLETAPVVLLAAFEPEEESPIVFLRLRKAARKRGLAVYALAPFTSAGSRKMSATLLQAAPGTEPEYLDALAGGDERSGLDEAGVACAQALRSPGAVICVGERLGAVPGALSAVLRLAEATGARIAWVPRRAGERGAVEAGCLPTLLPGGQRSRAAGSGGTAGSAVERAWGELPTEQGRDTTAILEATVRGELAGLVVGGVDPDDLPDPALADAALDAAGFLVSLEIRHSAVTGRADVVFPVAPAVHKDGTFVDWEGRRRPFVETLRGTGGMPDFRVLDRLADELGTPLRLPDVDAVRRELDAVVAAAGTGGGPGERPRPPAVAAGEPPVPGRGQAVLASWHFLLDNGRLQDGEPYLAGTARHARVMLSAETAREIGATAGDFVTVSNDRGAMTLPLVLADLPERVVWVPTNSDGSALRRKLGVVPGVLVDIAVAEPPAEREEPMDGETLIDDSPEGVVTDGTDGTDGAHGMDRTDGGAR